MIRARAKGMAVVGAFLLALAGAAAEDKAPLSVKGFAEGVQLQAEPGHPFRYNVGTGPYGPPTKPLIERRRAYFPGEKVRLTFKLPADAKVDAALEIRVTFSLADLDGRAVQTLEPVPLKATSAGVSGAVEWTVGRRERGPVFPGREVRGRRGQGPGDAQRDRHHRCPSTPRSWPPPRPRWPRPRPRRRP